MSIVTGASYQTVPGSDRWMLAVLQVTGILGSERVDGNTGRVTRGMKTHRERERERETDRQRDRERQKRERERERERQADRQTDRETDRQTDRQTDRERIQVVSKNITLGG